ncbi:MULTISPECIES: isochorismatase family protein [unclassified Streptomyces]|uniref:isochorismatase family protein n=1 Tax=unclassified Streptomyces TaxID=2593676 RepID=UPI002E8226C0|nr:isochorismatase family protein [Streptomyces sp. NBC_00589]WTI34817.1 isochorismatase family protein [Streptomyces sp. NBC_00775]WUB31509.1 isochorismatase family protein [Streptomyces sp. NBC_00589]
MTAPEAESRPALDPARTALVLVDLMDRIVALPLEPRKGTEVLSTAEGLAVAFRKAGALVVLIRVERPKVAEQPSGSGFAAGLAAEGDIEIVKRTIGGFQGTGLDERLREHGVTTLVFGGIATNLGVESTARAAGDLGYDLVFAEDAMAAFTAAEHDASVRLDFPRLGTVVTAAQVHFGVR